MESERSALGVVSLGLHESCDSCLRLHRVHCYCYIASLENHGLRLRFPFILHVLLDGTITRRAPGISPAVGATGPRQANAVPLAVRAGVAQYAEAFHLAVRTPVAFCAVVFQLAVGARVALHAYGFAFTVGTPFAFHRNLPKTPPRTLHARLLHHRQPCADGCVMKLERVRALLHFPEKESSRNILKLAIAEGATGAGGRDGVRERRTQRRVRATHGVLNDMAHVAFRATAAVVVRGKCPCLILVSPRKQQRGAHAGSRSNCFVDGLWTTCLFVACLQTYLTSTHTPVYS